MSLKDINVIKYYLDECQKRNLTIKQLQEKIKNKEYERLSDISKNKLINKENLEIYDLVPNPILIRTAISNETLTEYALKHSILNNIDEFLIQLGNGFAYIGNEFKIKFNGYYNYIDLLLFNYEYNCFVVIELKVCELKKEHIGQIEIYMNYVDNNLRNINQNRTIGIIICKKDNKYVIKYCSDKRIISREYELVI